MPAHSAITLKKNYSTVCSFFQYNRDEKGYVNVYTDGACKNNGRDGAQVWRRHIVIHNIGINYTVPHRLIIPRLTKLFVFLENWTFCCPVLCSRHCTCAYTETVDPTCRPSIPHKWYWHSIVRQGSARFNLTWKRYRPLPFFPLEVHTLWA